VIWTYHRSTGGTLDEVPGGGSAVESVTVEGALWARTRQARPLKGDRWDYRCAGDDATVLAGCEVGDPFLAVLSAFGVA
jgi:hypothetical protein